MLARQARLARRQGLDRLRVVVSFDCDTDRDIEVVTSVHERCLAAGVKPMYAVPGELLRAGAAVYTAIAAAGAEFMNHGDARHTSLDPSARTYTGSHFYDRLSRDDAAEDVRKGHQAVVEVLGATPAGFRTPHFGTFQHRAALSWLHRLLASMGYRWSSSTMPLHGARHGPLPRRDGVVEIAVAGRPSAPNRVLDTWSFRFAPGRSVTEDDYLADVRSLVRWHVDAGAPGLVNLYGDPSQVEDWPDFFDLLAELAPYAAPSLSAVLDEAGR